MTAFRFVMKRNGANPRLIRLFARNPHYLIQLFQVTRFCCGSMRTVPHGPPTPTTPIFGRLRGRTYRLGYTTYITPTLRRHGLQQAISAGNGSTKLTRFGLMWQQVMLAPDLGSIRR